MTAWAHRVLGRLLAAEPAQLIQYTGTLLAAAAAFGIGLPLGWDAKIPVLITAGVLVRDVLVGRTTRAAVFSPASFAHLAEAAKAFGAPADKVDAAVQLIQSGRLDALQQLLVAGDDPGRHAADQ